MFVLCPVGYAKQILVSVGCIDTSETGEVYIGSSELKVIGMRYQIKAMEVNEFNLNVLGLNGSAGAEDPWDSLI